VHVVVLAVHLDEACVEVAADRGEDLSQLVKSSGVEHVPAVLRHEDQVHMKVEDKMSAMMIRFLSSWCGW